MLLILYAPGSSSDTEASSPVRTPDVLSGAAGARTPEMFGPAGEWAPEMVPSYTAPQAAEMRALLQAVAQAGHTPTLPPPPVTAVRRCGLWRNVLITPEHNSRSMPLEYRRAEQVWHPAHGEPPVPRCVMDEAHAWLRALHASLPLDRVATPTRTCRDAESFARRYGKPLATALETAGAMTEEGRLHESSARRVLVPWFRKMARPKRGSDNAFQWRGFYLRDDAEGVAYCEQALQCVLLSDAP